MSDFDPFAKYADNLLIDDRRQFPAMRREWTGDRVCIRYVAKRGNSRSYTSIRFAFGTLVEGERGDNIGVQTKDGYVGIHYRRITEVWNLSKRRGNEPSGADLYDRWHAAGDATHAFQRRPLGHPGCGVCGAEERHWMHERSAR